MKTPVKIKSIDKYTVFSAVIIILIGLLWCGTVIHVENSKEQSNVQGVVIDILPKDSNNYPSEVVISLTDDVIFIRLTRKGVYLYDLEKGDCIELIETRVSGSFFAPSYEISGKCSDG